jgi:formate hydrogenlyase subunit 6/NADH:ubiquinone oxidoreductase subunit I
MFGRGRNQRNKLKQRSKVMSQFGICICSQCNYSVTHKRGIPCVSLLCPNCNILLVKQGLLENRNLQPSVNKETKNSSFLEIATELCVGCGACVEICPADAIFMEDGKAKITTENCRNCRVCVSTCPVYAIT